VLDQQLQSLGTFPVATTAVGELGFSEALFEYSGQGATQLVLDFGDTVQSFALDNLVYQVPEPASMASCALLIACCWLRRPRALRQKRSADDSRL
jgi:hypothetical protein